MQGFFEKCNSTEKIERKKVTANKAQSQLFLFLRIMQMKCQRKFEAYLVKSPLPTIRMVGSRFWSRELSNGTRSSRCCALDRSWRWCEVPRARSTCSTPSVHIWARIWLPVEGCTKTEASRTAFGVPSTAGPSACATDTAPIFPTNRVSELHFRFAIDFNPNAYRPK